MRNKALAVDCPVHEPDPVLLQQLTALAAASTAPAAKPWWHRFTAKTGAAAVAGVLLITGAVADAEHAKPVPAPARSSVGRPIPHPAVPGKPLQASTSQTYVRVPPVAPRRTVGSMRHAGKWVHHRQHAHVKKHREGRGNVGRNGNGHLGLESARVALSPAFAAVSNSTQHSPSRAPLPQRAHSQH